jgi:hypothetical protein
MFDRSRRTTDKAVRPVASPQSHAPAVCWIAPTLDELFTHQSLHDASDRARVQVKNVRKLARREAGTPRHDPKDKALRSSDAERGFHPLRSDLEPVLHAPEQPHEIEDRVRAERCRGAKACRRSMVVHTGTIVWGQSASTSERPSGYELEGPSTIVVGRRRQKRGPFTGDEVQGPAGDSA